MSISIPESVAAASSSPPSERVLRTAAMFGLGAGEQRELTIVPPCEIPFPAESATRGSVIFITGPSGGGKSTLLRLIARECLARGRRVIGIDDTHPPHASSESSATLQSRDRAVIDAIAPGSTFEHAVSLLSMTGLADAFVMLRSSHELSDGQRCRFQLARMIAQAECEPTIQPLGDADKVRILAKTQIISRPVGALTAGAATTRPTCRAHDTVETWGADAAGHVGGAVMIADEFCATLDRLTARTIARNIRRWIDATRHVFIAATTHDDLLEPLQPDVLIWKGLGDELEVHQRPRDGNNRFLP